MNRRQFLATGVTSGAFITLARDAMAEQTPEDVADEQTESAYTPFNAAFAPTVRPTPLSDAEMRELAQRNLENLIFEVMQNRQILRDSIDSPGLSESALMPPGVENLPRGSARIPKYFVYPATYDQSNPIPSLQFVDPWETEPRIQGSDEEPDVEMSLKLSAFQVADASDSKRDARALMRVTTGTSSGNPTDESDIFWVLNTAINVYGQYQAAKRGEKVPLAQPRQKPLAIPIYLKGGVGSIKLEVVQSSETTFFQKVIGFLKGDTAQTVAAAFGLPVVTRVALNAVDALLTRMMEKNQKTLMGGEFLQFAFSRRGKDALSGDGSLVASLGPGRWLFSTYDAYTTINAQKPLFDTSIGRLVPGEAKGNLPGFYDDIYKNPKNDPFGQLTYALIDVEQQSRKSPLSAT